MTGNYMDKFLSWLESTTPEERLGRKPETAEAVEHPPSRYAPSPIPSTTTGDETL